MTSSFDQRMLSLFTPSAVVTVLSGAGISAESGVPTFREAQKGLWAQYRPEDLATPQAFRRHPQRVWRWYLERRLKLESVTPNAGHLALVELENRVGKVHVVTQNVDGLHQAAGSDHVIELHGNIKRSKCLECHQPYDDDELRDGEPPTCGHCKGFIRPDVVWFGEALPAQACQRAFELAAISDVVISVGTSGLVQPAASIPFEALNHGVPILEVNPEETPLTPRANWSVRGLAGTVLPQLIHQIRGGGSHA